MALTAARHEEDRQPGPHPPTGKSGWSPWPRKISGILDWIEQLGEVDTDGVEPMTSAVASKLPMREDVVTDGGDPARVLSNAPKTDRNFFVVPKVVE